LLPSGVSAMFQGRRPTAIVATIAFVAVSITWTVPSPPEVTNTRLPSGWTITPLLRAPALMRAITSCVEVSNTLTVSAFSAAT
jgi:hypothetical protein